MSMVNSTDISKDCSASIFRVKT